MNRFGQIADELSELIEELETPALKPDSTALRRALQRAFVQACLAEQAMRRREEPPRDAQKPPQSERRSVKVRVKGVQPRRRL
jgi:hypothetical protein